MASGLDFACLAFLLSVFHRVDWGSCRYSRGDGTRTIAGLIGLGARPLVPANDATRSPTTAGNRRRMRDPDLLRGYSCKPVSCVPLPWVTSHGPLSAIPMRPKPKERDMSRAKVRTQTATRPSQARRVDTKLEVVVIPGLGCRSRQALLRWLRLEARRRHHHGR